MPSYYEDLLRPSDYGGILNVHIYKPPLISTSLHELAAAGWNCWIEAKRIKTKSMTKVRLRFNPPSGGPSGLNFDVWTDFHISRREEALQFLRKLDVIKEPNHLTENTATIKADVSYQEIAYSKMNPTVLGNTCVVPVKISEQLYLDLKAVHGDTMASELGRMVDDYFYDRQVYESKPVLSTIDMILDHPNLGDFEVMIMDKINQKRGENLKITVPTTNSRVEADFSVSPYFDTYDENKGYSTILFRPTEPSLPIELTEYFERVFGQDASSEELEPA